MFSTFPGSWPGAGLLLLRVAGGALLTIQGACYLLHWSNFRLTAYWLALLAGTCGTLLLIGYLTRFAAFVAALGCGSGVFSWFPVPGLDLFAAKLPCLLVAVMATALICLGPGAFSIDSRLFGRRELIIPANPRA